MSITRIYCEGKADSHDQFILEKITESLPDVIIRPIGGKRGANAIMEYYENSVTAAKADFYLLFRDRDFDCEIPQKEELIFDGRKTYFSYRTTIENYLFDIHSFYTFITKRGLNREYRIHDANDVSNLFIEIAKKIKDYQIVRHALGKLRNDISFNTTWTKGSGFLPESLDLENCRKTALEILNQAVEKTEHWKKENLDEGIEYFSTVFDDDFFNRLDFLVWFQGKDFAQALKNTLTNFPIKAYYTFVRNNFGNYAEKNGRNNHLYPDLLELRQIIISKTHKS
ncbi:MAG: hypothetical protein LBL04_05495 [Bacteroidales bacterium]|jgi:hypothetical protein|nr:hypothetical protein [Bacteroidales bacterium]